MAPLKQIPPNEAMKHKGKTITSNEKKAEIFAKHYASVSRHQFTKEERDINRECKKKLRTTRGNKEWDPFTLPELRRAIKQMKRKGAAGPDDIPPSFLKELGPNALQELLEIFNCSFKESFCPQIWRLAHIIPLLKSGKPASELASFRPISLTSCVVKALERMVNDRLYHMAESQRWFRPAQAGFRKGRGCEDQIGRLIQQIQDGFQNKPFKRSVIVLLDFSKAYDTVWKQKLLISLQDQGVPPIYVHWLNNFLSNRIARARMNGKLGKAVTMRQGLPQGSVLSPILFLFYINDLAKILPEETTNALFADDVTLLATANTLQEAEEICQRSVDVVVKWSKEWRISLNIGKSESSFFSNSTRETAAKWTPSIKIEDKSIKYNPTPRLLGVILDRSLCFGPHVASIEERIAPKLRTISCLSNTSWGWKKDYLKRVYTANIKSIFNYAGFAWQQCLSETQREKLERIQSRALRKITGQTLNTPREALLLEAGEESLKTQFQRNAVIAAEKALRLPQDHPRRIAYEQTNTSKRIQRKSWGTTSRDLLQNLPNNEEMSNRKPLVYFNHPPWIPDPRITIFSTLPGIESKNADQQHILESALTQIRSFNPTYTIYTDGSASSGTTNGGAGVVLSTGDPSELITNDTLKVKGAKFTSSYEEEVRAMERAAEWIAENTEEADTVVIGTDSQSLCQALENCNREVDQIRHKLSQSKARTIIQWLPGHCNIPGNEAADKAAKEATKIEGPHQPTSMKCARTSIKSHIKDRDPERPWLKEVYSKFSKTREKSVKSRRDQVDLARIRCGKHLAFAAYDHQLHDEVDPKCPKCDHDQHNLEHWFLDCPGTRQARQEIFGEEADDGLSLLTRRPEQSIALARRTLLGARD